jgi:hypothetical protein
MTAANSPRTKPLRRAQVQSVVLQDVREVWVCNGCEVMGGIGGEK